MLVAPSVTAFCTVQPIPEPYSSTTKLYGIEDSLPSQSINRRNILSQIVFISGAVFVRPSAVQAIPMITTDEFDILLRDSSLSVQLVEFAGPRGEAVTVKLVDGTVFGIKDVVESSTDPRSPLKIAAACRENGVKTKFVELESILAGAPKKKKMYTNQRVQDAQEKEREKEERMRQDEEERLAQLRKLEMEQEPAKTTSKN